MSNTITGRFAITFTNPSQDAAWVFQTEEEARSHGFAVEGRFELWEACEGLFEYDTRNGSLAAPMDRELLDAWEYFEEYEEDGEWAVRHTSSGMFFCGLEGAEARFSLDGFLKGPYEAVEGLLKLLEDEARIEGLEIVQVKGV